MMISLDLKKSMELCTSMVLVITAASSLPFVGFVWSGRREFHSSCLAWVLSFWSGGCKQEKSYTSPLFHVSEMGWFSKCRVEYVSNCLLCLMVAASGFGDRLDVCRSRVLINTMLRLVLLLSLLTPALAFNALGTLLSVSVLYSNISRPPTRRIHSPTAPHKQNT